MSRQEKEARIELALLAALLARDVLSLVGMTDQLTAKLTIRQIVDGLAKVGDCVNQMEARDK